MILLAAALLGPAVAAGAGLLHLVLIVAGVIVGVGATVLAALLVWRWRMWGVETRFQGAHLRFLVFA